MIQKTIEELIRADDLALRQLQIVRDCGPVEAFVAAGFVRNRVWDSFYNSTSAFPNADVDVVYFDAGDITPEQDYAYEAELKNIDAETDWQVRNQARMHHFHGYPPFASLEDGLKHWAETATSVGVRLDHKDMMHFVAPFGFEDLEKHILRITPTMKMKDPEGFDARLERKNWLARWPNLKVIRSGSI
ncbi:MAG: nucleotidyltransferase family protein [Kordiimonas sp.]